MFDSTQWKDLGRAARAMAYQLRQDLIRHQGTTTERLLARQLTRFEDLASRCEAAAKLASAPPTIPVALPAGRLPPPNAPSPGRSPDPRRVFATG